MNIIEQKFIRYGIPAELAEKALNAGLTISKAKALNRKDLVSKFNMTELEAIELSKCLKRRPINRNTLHLLLENSNYVCNVCKGKKSSSFVVHHIEEYEKSQDNNYCNLVVLCPADHDLAHQSGLSLKITKEQLRKSKQNWEKEVEISNADRASKAINIHYGDIDYINIKGLKIYV